MGKGVTTDHVIGLAVDHKVLVKMYVFLGNKVLGVGLAWLVK